jgi:hypothetical protein
MREFVPAQYRYANIEQAAEKIKAELSGWSKSNAEEMKLIASQFSYQNFMKRFIALFDAYCARTEDKTNYLINLK